MANNTLITCAHGDNINYNITLSNTHTTIKQPLYTIAQRTLGGKLFDLRMKTTMNNGGNCPHNKYKLTTNCPPTCSLRNNNNSLIAQETTSHQEIKLNQPTTDQSKLASLRPTPRMPMSIKHDQ
eukprot:7638711-Lingulodinium_polyedra.AAC.1